MMSTLNHKSSRNYAQSSNLLYLKRKCFKSTCQNDVTIWHHVFFFTIGPIRIFPFSVGANSLLNIINNAVIHIYNTWVNILQSMNNDEDVWKAIARTIFPVAKFTREGWMGMFGFSIPSLVYFASNHSARLKIRPRALLITLYYLRCYPTFEQLANTIGSDKSSVNRLVFKCIDKILTLHSVYVRFSKLNSPNYPITHSV